MLSSNMTVLRDIFKRHAGRPFEDNDTSAVAAADTGQDAAGQQDHMTLERTIDPFVAFMRNLEFTLTTDPKAALYMGRMALLGDNFKAPQMDRLSARVNAMIEDQTPQGSLRRAFTVNEYGINPAALQPQAPAPGMAPQPQGPVYSIKAPAFTPFG